MRHAPMFKLHQDSNGRGLRCDHEGLFLGRRALLREDADGSFEARPAADLRQVFNDIYGDETDWESRIRSVTLVASALNKGDMARAMMIAVLMRLPDPDAPVHIAELDRELAKAGFNPDEPRDERGRWTTGGSDIDSDVPERDPRIQLADAGMSDASNDPIAQAVARDSSENNSTHDKPVTGEQANFWQTLGAHLSNAANAYFTEVGQAQINESDAKIAAATSVARAIADALRTYETYREQPWIGPKGTPEQVPAIDVSDPYSALGGLIEHELFEPNAPLMRPGTNADWIDPIVNAASELAVFAGPALEFSGTAGRLAAGASELADNAPFIILPKELPSDFDLTLPVGRFIPRDDLPFMARGTDAHMQIGDLLQGRFGQDVQLTLNTGPSETDADIIVPSDKVDLVGFEYAEIKPMSLSGYYRFRQQVVRWNYPYVVQAITYDWKGNIYYGFVGPWQ